MAKFPWEEKAAGWMGDPSRGAQMGRTSDPIEKINKIGRRLRRVPMVEGDYDKGGAYWGGPPTQPLYCVWDPEGNVAYFRAASREEARAKLDNWPDK